MSRKHRSDSEWPGGSIGGVPLFNPANVAHVEESNRKHDEQRAMMEAFDDLPDAAFFAIADEMGIDFSDED